MKSKQNEFAVGSVALRSKVEISATDKLSSLTLDVKFIEIFVN